MNYPTHDTNWATSAKGNDWRRLNGKVLVVGKKKAGGYWSMVDGTFLPGEFKTQRVAMNAATDAAMPNVFDDWNWE
jgi:hypothetical protein